MPSSPVFRSERLVVGVLHIAPVGAEFEGVRPFHPSEGFVAVPGGPAGVKISITAVAAERIDIDRRGVLVAEDAGNLGHLVHAAVAGIIDLGWVIQETKSEMVKQVRPEGVIPVEPRQLGVARYARVIGVDHGGEGVLGKGKGAPIMVCNAHVIVVANVLIASNVPLVGVGRQAAGQSNWRFKVRA